MPYEYKIDKNKNIVFIRFHTILNDKLLIAAFNEIYADTEYTPVMNQCVDYSDVSELSITRLGIEELVTLCENFDCLNVSWETTVVAPNDFVFSYARMYQILGDDTNEEVSIVRTLEAAMKSMGMEIKEYPFQQDAAVEFS